MRLSVVVPTRGRPGAASELIDTFRETCESGSVHLVFAVDDDDPNLEDYCTIVAVAAITDPWVQIRVNPRYRMGPTLNLVATDEAQRAQVVGFMGDDHRPRTVGWDVSVCASLEGSAGVAYGNDLVHGENLPTAAFITSDVIRALGYMVPTGLIHLYMDNFWLDLGRATALRYLNDMVIEHMHPIVGKAEMDAGYLEANSAATTQHDAAEYQRFIRDDWPAESLRVRSLT